MARKLPKTESLFDCADLIKPLKCSKCVNFETHHLAHLKHHFKADHTLPEWEEKLYGCESCIFLTYSKYIWLRHKLLNLCTGGGKVKSEPAIPEGTRASQIEEKNETDGDLKCDSVKSKLSKCEHRIYTKNHLKRNISVKNTQPDKNQWLECAQRPQEAESTNGKNLKCDQCPFETKRNQVLRDHIIRKHTERDKIQWWQCAQCAFRGKTKRSLNSHVGYKHRYRKDLRCAHCPFETKNNASLKGHILTQHAKPDEIQWFECAQCPFKCKLKSSLKQHIGNKHGEKKLMKCDQCAFETKYKHLLKSHSLLKHTDFEKLQWLHCEHCSYKNKADYLLRAHVRKVHANKDALKCDHCTFKTNYKRKLETHNLLKHTQFEKHESLLLALLAQT